MRFVLIRGCVLTGVGMRLLFCGGKFIRKCEAYKLLDISSASPYANHSKLISYAEPKVLFLNVFHSTVHFMSPC